MGFVTGTIRLLYLTQLKNDLEHRIMLVTESRRELAESISSLMEVGTNLDPNSPVIQNLRARRANLEKMEKRLEEQMTKYQTKLQAVEKEIGEAEKHVSKCVDREFSYGLGR